MLRAIISLPASSGSFVDLPWYRSGASAVKPSAPNRSHTSLMCGTRPHHSWMTIKPSPAPRSGLARYPDPVPLLGNCTISPIGRTLPNEVPTIRLVDPAELAVVPRDHAPHVDGHARALAGEHLRHHLQLLRVGDVLIPAGHVAGDLHERLRILGDLGRAHQLDPAQLVVRFPGLEQTGDAVVTLEVLDLLGLGERLEPRPAVAAKAVPHGDEMDGLVVVEGGDVHRPAPVEELVDLRGAHLDQVSTARHVGVLLNRAQQLRRYGAVDAPGGLLHGLDARRPDHAVDQVERDDLVVGVPRVAFRLEPLEQRVPQARGKAAATSGDQAGHGDVDRVDIPVQQPADEPRPLAQRVDHEHLDVPAAGQSLRDLLRPAEDAHGGVVGQSVGQLGRRAVGRHLVGDGPALAPRVGRGEHPGRQPPHRPRRDVAVEDPAAGGDEAGRVEPEGTERARRLPHEHRLIRARRPGHVAEPLNRMHRLVRVPPRPARLAGVGGNWIPSAAVIVDPAGAVRLTPLKGDPRPLEEWLTTFHLVLVVLDPYTYESAWLLDTAGRILESYAGADCRVGFLVTAPTDETRQFLGPWATQMLTFADPDREFVKAVGLERLPALVHIDLSGHVVGAAQGWHPEEWRVVLANLSRMMSWSRPNIPSTGDPAPFEGSEALAG